MVSVLNNIELKILDKINDDEFYNKTLLAEALGISFVTISKYVDILEAKCLLDIKKFGNNQLIRSK